jgi:hypothetical protein
VKIKFAHSRNLLKKFTHSRNLLTEFARSIEKLLMMKNLAGLDGLSRNGWNMLGRTFLV